MFKKEKCNGCRKDKYFVKKRQVRPKFLKGLPVTTEEALCRKCFKVLKKLNYAE